MADYIITGTVVEWESKVEGPLRGEVLDDHSDEYLKVGYYTPGHGGLTIVPNMARTRLTISEDQSDGHKITVDIEARREASQRP